VAVVSGSLQEEFDRWVVKNNRKYATEAEYNARFNIWLSTLEKVNKFNAEGHSWQLGMNNMADLTEQEFKEKYLSSKLILPRADEEVTPSPLMPSLTPIDWRTRGCVVAVKNQGSCGSCYAFASTAVIESCKCIAGGALTSLSEQQLVDCTLSYGNLACSGGWYYNCWDYIIDVGGIQGTSSYPYTGVRGTCKASASLFVSRIGGYVHVTATDAAVQTAVLGRPLAVAIDASTNWQSYTSGVWCGTCTTTVNHAVTLVGQNTGAPDYYIIKNSWGLNWGESGYIRQCANVSNKCAIATYAYYTTGCS
jgi:hypothetical protein